MSAAAAALIGYTSAQVWVAVVVVVVVTRWTTNPKSQKSRAPVAIGKEKGKRRKTKYQTVSISALPRFSFRVCCSNCFPFSLFFSFALLSLSLSLFFSIYRVHPKLHNLANKSFPPVSPLRITSWVSGVANLLSLSCFFSGSLVCAKESTESRFSLSLSLILFATSVSRLLPRLTLSAETKKITLVSSDHRYFKMNPQFSLYQFVCVSAW